MLRVERATEPRARLPWGALALVGAGLLAVAAIERSGGADLCHLRRWTGVPCPTCGTTRGVLAVLDGDWLGAWRSNPLVFTVAPLVAGAALLRGLAGRRFVVGSSALRRALLLLFLAALAANWLYLARSLDPEPRPGPSVRARAAARELP